MKLGLHIHFHWTRAYPSTLIYVLFVVVVAVILLAVTL